MLSVPAGALNLTVDTWVRLCPRHFTCMIAACIIQERRINPVGIRFGECRKRADDTSPLVLLNPPRRFRVKRFLALITAIASIALVCPVLAQPAPGGSGGGSPVMGSRSMRSAAMSSLMLARMYNPGTVTTVKGGVLSLGTMPPKSQQPGTMRTAVLKTEQGDIPVFLAPDWYLTEQNISLKTGDQVEVTGSKITLSGNPTILARDLKLGDKSAILRNIKGFPVWLKGQPGARPVK
jgi:hypothetical protein